MEWKIFDLAKPRYDKKLPVVLSRDEVWRILDEVTIDVYRVCLTTIYSCGLRLLEGATLEIPQIDSDLMQLHIHGTGACDRYAPLPEGTLLMLRGFWRTHRSPILLFPSISRKGLKHCEDADEVPIHRSNLQGAFRRARDKAGIGKKAHIHTLRHSYATHLLEDGASWIKPRKRTYILPDYGLARVFREGVEAACRKAGLYNKVPRKVWPRCPKCGSPYQQSPVAIPRSRAPP